MKIYTKTGDDGTTGLFGGARVSKSDPRVECTGAIDELNAALGLAACEARVAVLIHPVQSDLFSLGAAIATPRGTPPSQITQDDIDRLEHQIDAAEAQLPPLRNFILPGGHETGARLHFARTLCRRAERALVAYSAQNSLPPLALAYINRLSDWLFVQARRANQIAGVEDVIWEENSKSEARKSKEI